MKKTHIIFTAVFCLLPVISFAQTSARDADIDLKLNAGMLAGIAPPTGAQSNAAVVSAPQFDPYTLAAMQSGKVIVGQADRKARVYEVKGNVRLIKKGSPVEKKLVKDEILEIGDKIYTEAGASASITFDESYKNAVHITENSKAVFEGIEPTNIRIENGSVFSSVNGLAQGSTWKVTTPSAVAAVRGTLYIVTFQAASGQFFAATVNVPDDGKESAIDIQPITGSGSANIPEGKEITLQQGQSPDQSMVADIDPAVLSEIMSFFENLAEQQKEEADSNFAPPTGGSEDPSDGQIGEEGDSGNSNLDPSDFIPAPEDNAPPSEPEPEPLPEPEPDPIPEKCDFDNDRGGHRGGWNDYDRGRGRGDDDKHNNRDHDRDDRGRNDHDFDRDDRGRGGNDNHDRDDKDRGGDRGGDDHDKNQGNDQDRDKGRDDDRGDRGGRD